MKTFEQLTEHSKKYFHNAFLFDNCWYDAFHKNKPIKVEQKYIDAVYELIGNEVVNAYYDITDTLNNLRNKTLTEEYGVSTWGDFMVVFIFLNLVNNERKINRPFDLQVMYTRYTETLKDLINEYLKESEEM